MPQDRPHAVRGHHLIRGSVYSPQQDGFPFRIFEPHFTDLINRIVVPLDHQAMSAIKFLIIMQ